MGLAIESSPATSTTHNARSLSEETKQLVLNFYNTDDFTWQAPGRKDRIIIRETDVHGGKVKRTEQVRYLLMSLKEAHNKFRESNADAKIGLSKFCDLRPQHVKLFDHIPHYVCVCQYHENIRLLLTALRGHTLLSVEFRPFIDKITCDSSSKACMYSECSTCKSKIDNYSLQTLLHSKISMVNRKENFVHDTFKR